MNKKIISLGLALALSITSMGSSFALNTNRLAGANRYETSVNLSKKDFNQSDIIILASGEGFADALSGGQLALAYKCPLILTGKKNIPKSVREELARLKAKKIIILGGEGSISKEVEKSLGSYKVERIAGSNRYDTSKKIREKTMGITGSKKTVVVSGKNYPDALSAIGYLAKTNSTMLLSDGRKLPNVGGEILAIGGENSLKLPGFKGKRIAGKDRYITALNVAKEGYGQAKKAILVNGQMYPDALSATSLLTKNKMPVILTNKNSLSPSVKEYLKKTEEVVVVGGNNSVSEAIVSSLKNEEKPENKPETKPGNNDTVEGYKKISMYNMISMSCTQKMINEVGIAYYTAGDEKLAKIYNKLALKHDKENKNGENGNLAGMYAILGIVEQSKYNPPKDPSPNNDKLKLGSLVKDGKTYIVFLSPAHEIYVDLEDDKVAIQFWENHNEVLEALFTIDGISGKYTPGGNGYEYLKKAYENLGKN